MHSYLKTFIRCCCLCYSASFLFAQQHPIDRYLSESFTPITIATSSQRLSAPQDLDFCRTAGRENELWVLCKGDANGGFTVILFDAGKPGQKYQYRRDSHAGHFMRNASGIAMAASGNFATSPEILNTAGSQTSTFMGPTLWNSDTSVYARVNQNDWVDGEPLGSHSDMLHESPYSMGIAADSGNVYWLFDGYHGYIYRYDFQVPHPYGGDDHVDGIIRRYDVRVKRVANLPSHLVLDESNGWIYVVDNGNKRILRFDSRSGSYGGDLTDPNETLVEYSRIEGVTQQTIDTSANFGKLCGVDYFDGRLIVSDNGTGEIRIYNTTTEKPTYIGSIMTNDPGMMGVKIGPDSAIWYVNKSKNRVIRLEWGAPAAVSTDVVKSELIESIAPNPASAEVTISLTQPQAKVVIADALGRLLLKTKSGEPVNVLGLPNGVYYCIADHAGVKNIQKFVVSH